MTKDEQKREIFEAWNSTGIVVHKRLTHDIELEIARALKHYTLEEIKASIEFYATILEPKYTREQKEEGAGEYWWSYRWTLRDFLRRGVPKFDGQVVGNYKRRARVSTPEAVVFKRDK